MGIAPIDHRQILKRARQLAPSLGYEANAAVLGYGAPVGRLVEIHPRLDRCMERLRQMMARCETGGTSLASGTVVLAEELTAASGRFDRTWHAPPGGLWLAMAWSDCLLPEFAALLPLAAGVACCQAVRLHGVRCWLRWVNDVHVASRKLAGLLCQTVTSPAGERFHLVGIGINVNNQGFPADLEAIATSMHQQTGTAVDHQALLMDLLACLVLALGSLHAEETAWLEAGGPEAIDSDLGATLARWLSLSDTLGRTVVYGQDLERQVLYRASVLGLDRSGGLRLGLADGSETLEYSGEVRYVDECSP